MVGDFSAWIECKTFKLAGTLPASGLFVLMTMTYSSSAERGKFNLFCDDTIALNNLKEYFKKAIDTII